MRTLLHDLRYTWRTLRKSPAFAAAAILSLGLGIGANTAIFSVASALLARALPVAEPDRLVAVHRTMKAGFTEQSYPVYEDIRTNGSVFSGVEAHFPLLSLSIAGGGEPERIWGQLVTGNYFSVLGVSAVCGRTFLPEEDRTAGVSPVVVLSHSYWQRRFGGDSRIVGQQVTLNNHAFTVVGVAAAGFHGIDLGLAPDVWIPIGNIEQAMPQRPSLADRAAPWLQVNARLSPGVSREQAQAAMDVLARRLEQSYPNTDRGHGFRLDPASGFHPAYRGSVLGFAGAAMAVVGLVLVIACANVANIMLARASGRRKEIAIRVALGAGRGRLVRQMLTESMALALAGGAAGLLLTAWMIRLLKAFPLPPPAPIIFEVPIDARVLAFTLGLSALTGLIFGLAPAFRASRPELVPALKGTASAERPGQFCARDLLVVSQVAISLLLLIVTSLFLRSLGTASAIDPGFRTDRILVMSIDPRLHGYEHARAKVLFGRIAQQVEALPGVVSTTFTDVVPLAFAARSVYAAPEGREDPSLHRPRVDSFLAGTRYFETMGIPLVRGREFQIAGERSDPIAIVNETLARQFWPGQDPIGRRLIREGVRYEVIGVAEDTKSRSLGEERRPCLYLSMQQVYGKDATPFGVSLLVRTERDPAAMTVPVRREINAIDNNLAIFDVRTMEQQVRNALLLPRLGAMLFGGFGVVGLLLASVGLYGVITYSVSRRTREFGIRAAIGASSSDVLRLVVAKGAALAGSGAAIGLAAAFCLTRFLSSLLYGVSATDPVTFVGIPCLMIAIALLASWLPARRAAGTDPVLALRSE